MLSATLCVCSSHLFAFFVLLADKLADVAPHLAQFRNTILIDAAFAFDGDAPDCLAVAHTCQTRLGSNGPRGGRCTDNLEGDTTEGATARACSQRSIWVSRCWSNT